MNPRAATACALLVAGCGDARLYDERGISTGYRTGTVDDGYLSSGERGSVLITEVHWAGTVETVGDGFVHHPDDVFIELRNQHSRPIHLTGWQIRVEVGDDVSGVTDDGPSYGGRGHWVDTFVLPPRANGDAIDPNEYVVIAARDDGAFPDADYVISGLKIPIGRFDLTLRDLDQRLIDGAGSASEATFAGAWDLVTARSMERVQLIFANRGGRSASWHSYSLNAWDGAPHDALRAGISQAYRARTYATPGGPNSPDYSGNTSAGSDD